MTFVDPSTGILVTCSPAEYSEICKSTGWLRTCWESSDGQTYYAKEEE